MTEPDEATLWAREDWAKIRKAAGGPFQNTDAAEIRAGKKDVWGDVTVRAHAYRAGQAASAERIKALEAFLRHLRQWDQMNPPMTGDHAAHAASIDALLEEADR